MYTLYAREGAGSAIVEVLLEEAGLDYRIETIPRRTDSRFNPSFYEVNPLGQVPALVFPDGTVMTESGAITLYFADLYPQLRLAPWPDSPQRPNFLRWLFYLAANIYVSDIHIYFPARHSTNPKHADAIKSAALAQMAHEWDVYAAALGSGPFILGEDLSAVDIYAAMLVAWDLDIPALFRRHPNIKTMYDRIIVHPVVAKVWARNAMHPWDVQAASA